MDFRDIGIRAVKTAIQTFGAEVTASGLGLLTFVQDATLLEKALLAALGGGVSVVWNATLRWSQR